MDSESGYETPDTSSSEEAIDRTLEGCESD